MPTRNISLTKQQDAFIAKIVESGEYQNASEAVRDALRTLQDRRRHEALKLKALRAAIKEGVDAMERGDYDEMEVGQFGKYLDSLSSGQRKGTR